MEPATGNVFLSGKTNIETVRVARGQYVDIFLEGIQVEMRVLPNGAVEIYSDEKFDILPFEKWWEPK